jgi:hypothetical protein
VLTSSVINRGLDWQSIGSVMNSVLTSGVINRGLYCQSIGSVMNSVLTSSVINRGLDDVSTLFITLPIDCQSNP